MSLRSAAVLALVGMILLTLLVIADFINVVQGILRDLIPAMMLLRSIIYLLASVGLTVFLWVFHRAQR
jgi:hypothetical protein